MKKILILLCSATLLVIIGTSGIKKVQDNTAPTSYTGAPKTVGGKGSYCTSCHSSYAINSGGGSVTVSGLPISTYVAGQTYNFSVTVNHGTADRKNWGFAIKAIDAAVASVGTFATTNTTIINTANISKGEMGQLTPPQTLSGANTYTFTGMSWTAPATPTTNQKTVTFYYVGNAANDDGSDKNDYIYSGSTAITLPLTLVSFNVSLLGDNVLLNWESTSEINTDHCEIERSADGKNFSFVASIVATGNSSTTTNYSYTDNTAPVNSPVLEYRLKIVDKDGSFQYSPIRTINTNSSEDFVRSVYPNPVIAGQPIKADIVASGNKNVVFDLYTTTGKKLASITNQVISGDNIINVSLGHYLIPGLYYLFIKIGNDKTQQTSIVVE